MLDLHCHILPGIDDGPADLGEALDLARFAVRDGITHVVATPHCHRELRTLRDAVRRHVDRLNADLAAAEVPLTVLPGAEIQCYDVAQYQKDYTDGVYCHLGDDPRFTLLEFPWNEWAYPAEAADHIAWLRDRGTTAVIAHPERHDYFRDDRGRLRAVVASGAWLQITPDSLLGNHGPFAQKAGYEMLAEFPDAVLASDAHAVGRRCSGLAVGYRLAAERFGRARAEDLRVRSDAILRHLTGPPPNTTGNGP